MLRRQALGESFELLLYSIELDSMSVGCDGLVSVVSSHPDVLRVDGFEAGSLDDFGIEAGCRIQASTLTEGQATLEVATVGGLEDRVPVSVESIDSVGLRLGFSVNSPPQGSIELAVLATDLTSLELSQTLLSKQGNLLRSDDVHVESDAPWLSAGDIDEDEFDFRDSSQGIVQFEIEAYLEGSMPPELPADPEDLPEALPLPQTVVFSPLPRDLPGNEVKVHLIGETLVGGIAVTVGGKRVTEAKSGSEGIEIVALATYDGIAVCGDLIRIEGSKECPFPKRRRLSLCNDTSTWLPPKGARCEIEIWREGFRGDETFSKTVTLTR